MTDSLHFEHLLPETIFAAVEEQAYQPTGIFYPLNSYENRVYEIQLEEKEPLIAKFYRPKRWTVDAIAEEHRFLKALDEVEIPLVLAFELKKSIEASPCLGEIEGIIYALYPKFRGREHAEILNEDRKWLGRSLARLHNVGENFQTKHRLVLNPETYGHQNLGFILSQDFLPDELKGNIENLLLQAIQLTEQAFLSTYPAITVHGDCHPANILWNHDGPHLLDFDDMVQAPAVQDIWMLFNGSPEEMEEQKKVFFEGYEMFRDFDYGSLRLTESLRTLRMIKHAAWIGERYSEPLFQKAFPYYRDRRYWEEFLLSIKEQISLMQDAF